MLTQLFEYQNAASAINFLYFFLIQRIRIQLPITPTLRVQMKDTALCFTGSINESSKLFNYISKYKIDLPMYYYVGWRPQFVNGQ